ncbi:MAG: hypothetical protein PHO91_03395 [Patescibacteria group bacterium]|nr:hypothetical protein [Patescibacteria group bacterium]
MNKKLLLPLLFISLLFLGACTRQKTDQPNINLAENNSTPIIVKMFVQSDKTAYRSYEKVNLSIDLISDRDLENVLIEAKGINNDFNRSYFNQNKTVNLKKQSTYSLNFSQTLPACNSCFGLTPGNYNIKISASHQGKVLETETINLSISQ